MGVRATRPMLATAALALATITVGFDITILNVALPTIAIELEVGTSSCSGW